MNKIFLRIKKKDKNSKFVSRETVKWENSLFLVIFLFYKINNNIKQKLKTNAK